MNSREIVISKKLVYIVIGLGILVAVFLLAGKFFAFSRSQDAVDTSVDGSKLVAGSPEKFAYLSGQGEQRSVGST